MYIYNFSLSDFNLISILFQIFYSERGTIPQKIVIGITGNSNHFID